MDTGALRASVYVENEMKRIRTWLLLFVCVLGFLLLPEPVQAEEEAKANWMEIQEGEFTWRLDLDNHTAAVKKWEWNGSTGAELTVPAGVSYQYIWYPATAVMGHAFTYEGTEKDYKGPERIILPDTVEALEPYAFFAASITAAELPDKITMIPDYCFFGCYGLEEVDVPEGITYIGRWAFQNDGMLKSLSLPSTLTGFDPEFYSGNAEISISEKNPCFEAANNVLFSKDNTKLFKASALTEGETYRVPAGVTQIGPYAFAGTNVSRIILPEGLSAVGEGAFSDCPCLEDLTFPDSVTTLGNNITARSSSLQYIQFLGKTPPETAPGEEPISEEDSSEATVLVPKGTAKPYREALEGILTFDKVKDTETVIATADVHASIRIEMVSGGVREDYEFSLNGSTYKDSPVFQSCKPLKEYTVYARLKKNKEVLTVKITVPSLVTRITAEEIEVENGSSSGFEYRLNNGKWQKSTLFRNLKPDTAYTLYRRKTVKSGANQNKVIKETVKTRKAVKK
ncbi:leucine-rich repeat domain-containing protein [Anaerolentibacter hominis]|uniref:leucine-rich repeat domain-containing protein n=1 Tax=Anaerolentibacter hominis TaxID=3079009 RepID=UPI0031B8A958